VQAFDQREALKIARRQHRARAVKELRILLHVPIPSLRSDSEDSAQNPNIR
jgi:hypothetical protein